MPASFCFRKTDGTNETLAVIDDKIAEFLGEKPDEKYARFMDVASDFGIGILMRLGGDKIDEKLFKKWVVDILMKEPERFAQIASANEGKLIPCLHKFLCKDYTFVAWR